MRPCMKIVIVLSAALIGGQPTSAKYWPAPTNAPLRYRFKEGEQLRYVIDTRTVVKASVGGVNQDFTIKMDQIVDLSRTIVAVKNGTAQVVFKLERLRAAVDGEPTGKAEFDSQDGKDPPAPLSQMLGPKAKKLAGLEFTAAIDEQGHIHDLKVPEWLAKAPVNGPGTSLSGDNIKLLLEQSFLVLPKEAVVRGKTWNQQLASKTDMGIFHVDNVFTHEGPAQHLGSQVEKVNTTSAVGFKGAGNMPAEMKIQKASGKGTAYFDNLAGRLLETHWTMQLEMTLDAAGAGAGQELRAEVVQTLTVKLR